MLTNAIVPDRVGGLERYVRELAGRLVVEGFPTTVFTKQVDRDHPGRERGEDGVEIVRYPVPDKRNPLFVARRGLGPLAGVWREVAALRPAVCHAHFFVPALALALRRIPFVYTFHAPVYREILAERQSSYLLPARVQPTAVRVTRAVERFVVDRARRIIVLSEFMRRELALISPAAAARAELVPGGVDCDRFCPGQSIDDSWSGEDGPLLFAARRLTPRTGVRELVEAMPAIIARLPNARLVIAGTGAGAGELDATIMRLGLDGHVRRLGRVSEDDLVGWYRAADLVVMPTQELEGFGLATAEALACGTPVVGTAAGATPEILGPIDPMLVTDGTTPAHLAGTIIGVMEDGPRLARAASRARARALALSWDTVMRRQITIYREVDEERGRTLLGPARRGETRS